jgi:predicted amidohydrolase
MNVVRVGLAQLRCQPLDVVANVAATVQAAREAARAGAAVVVIPELASSGYVLDQDLIGSLAESTDQPGPALTAWRECAHELGITLVAGFPERHNGRIFNSAAVIGPDGDIAEVYRKLHLFSGEHGIFEPGDRGLPVVEVAGVCIGVLICYDLRFPEAVRLLALQGADIIAVPAAWVGGFDKPPPGEQTIGQVRNVAVQAQLNSVAIACASQVGDAGVFHLLGSSVAVDPYGRQVCGPLGRIHAETAVADIDLDLVRQARQRGPGISPLASRRTDVYDETLGYAIPARRPQYSEPRRVR